MVKMKTNKQVSVCVGGGCNDRWMKKKEKSGLWVIKMFSDEQEKNVAEEEIILLFVFFFY